MKKKFLAAAVALLAVTLLAGCYQIRSLTWSKDVVKPGEKTTANIGLSPVDDKFDGYFFILIQTVGDEDLKLSGAKFDTTKVLGKPQKMSNDPGLMNAVFEDDGSGCEGVGGRRLPEIATKLFRTNGVVPDNKFKPLQAKFSAKLGDENGILAQVETGIWIDDGDFSPEPDSDEDDIFCTGGSSTSLFPNGN